MNIAKSIFLLVIIGVYAWLGTWALLLPQSFAAAVDLQILSDLGSAEIRAIYGGLNTMIASLAAIVLFKKGFQIAFFGGFSLYLMGILLGRVVSVFVGEMQGLAVIGFTIFEGVFCALCIFLYKQK